MENITGRRIKALREERDLSKSDLARLMDMNTYNTVSSWENGTNYPRAKEIIKLCNYFGVSADYILGLSDEK